MLSKAELRFLIEGGTSSPGYDRVMRHRIRQKLLKFQRDDLPALAHNGMGAQLLDAILRITKNCNAITDSCNLHENVENQKIAHFARKVAPGRGFEPLRPKGPQVLQTCALPG
jgi:hypothetical protein